MLISQNLSFRHPICYSRKPVQQQQKGNNATFELHNINFPFCHEKCTTITHITYFFFFSQAFFNENTVVDLSSQEMVYSRKE